MQLGSLSCGCFKIGSLMAVSLLYLIDFLVEGLQECSSVTVVNPSVTEVQRMDHDHWAVTAKATIRVVSNAALWVLNKDQDAIWPTCFAVPITLGLLRCINVN